MRRGTASLAIATALVAALATPAVALAEGEASPDQSIESLVSTFEVEDLGIDGALVALDEGQEGVLEPQRGFHSGWGRLQGATAYDTMQSIVHLRGMFRPGDLPFVVLATGDGYHDALAAAGLAGITGAPVLITPSDSLGAQARAEIERLDLQAVYVVGGPMSVSDTVVQQVRDLGVTVERVAGQSASETAVEVWRAVDTGAVESSPTSWGDTAFVAASSGYWDALAAAPVSYRYKIPIFLAELDGTLSQGTIDAIRAGGFEHVRIVGGPMSVSDEVLGQLAGLDVVRISSDDAIWTSMKVAGYGIELGGMSPDFVTVASTSSYHDALTGAALAGKIGAPLVLVNPYGGYKGVQLMRDSGLGLQGGFVFGGPMSVSEENYGWLANGTPVLPQQFVGNWIATWDTGLAPDMQYLTIKPKEYPKRWRINSDGSVMKDDLWAAGGPLSFYWTWFAENENTIYAYINNPSDSKAVFWISRSKDYVNELHAFDTTTASIRLSLEDGRLVQRSSDGSCILYDREV